MMLMGNFWVTQIPDNLRSDIGVIPFPRISEAVDQYEEAPTDILFIPANAANKEAAEVFMAYMADSDVQARLNTAMGMLSPSKKGQQELDDFLSAGRRILDTAQGVSQFYDRDSAQPIATEGMVHMQRFVNREASLSEVLLELDELKKASYDRFSIANDDQHRKPAEEMIQ